jgi:hypothetical protein
MQLSRVCLSLILAVASLDAAGPAYVGKWKLNPAKSDFGSTTVTYTQLPSGETQCTVDGQSYNFKTDGKDYPSPFGNTAAWKSVDASTWQTTWKVNGKTVVTDRVKISPDGKTLTIEETGTKPNGEKIDDTTTYQRVSGGPGLAGKWKTQKMNSASPGVFEFSQTADVLTYKDDQNMTCPTRLDGKDSPCSGPSMGPGWTVAVTNVNARGFDLAVKKDGKLLYKYTYTVPADGKTMMMTGGATATNEKVTAIYDRQ